MDNLWLIYGNLLGGIPTPLKHMKVSWDDYPEENKHMFPTPNQLQYPPAI